MIPEVRACSTLSDVIGRYRIIGHIERTPEPWGTPTSRPDHDHAHSHPAGRPAPITSGTAAPITNEAVAQHLGAGLTGRSSHSPSLARGTVSTRASHQTPLQATDSCTATEMTVRAGSAIFSGLLDRSGRPWASHPDRFHAEDVRDASTC